MNFTDFFSKAKKLGEAAMSTPGQAYIRGVAERLFNPFEPSTVTENFFEDNEIDSLKSIVRSNVKENKNVIGYGNYKTDKPSNNLGYAVGIPDVNSPEEALRLTLGRASIKKDKDNNIIVVDSYDFNPEGEAKELVNKPITERVKYFYDTMDERSAYGNAHKAAELGLVEQLPVKVNLGSAEELGLSQSDLKNIPLIQDSIEEAGVRTVAENSDDSILQALKGLLSG